MKVKPTMTDQPKQPELCLARGGLSDLYCDLHKGHEVLGGNPNFISSHNFCLAFLEPDHPAYGQQEEQPELRPERVWITENKEVFLSRPLMPVTFEYTHSPAQAEWLPLLAKKLKQMASCPNGMCGHCIDLLIEARELLPQPPKEQRNYQATFTDTNVGDD